MMNKKLILILMSMVLLLSGCTSKSVFKNEITEDITPVAVNVPAERINLPDGAQLDAERECKRYDAAIKAAGGIDLQLLGMGLNGHIGFNEPDDYFSKGTHCVNLTESTIEANKRFFASADDVPRKA